MPKDAPQGPLLLLQILAASSLGLFTAAAAIHLRRRRKQTMKANRPIPRLLLTKSGRIDRLEGFSCYVARQLGFADAKECPQLGKLANDYLRKIKGCEENIYSFFASDPDAEALYAKLLDEFDRCILGYFAYHWAHTSVMISQILNDETQKQNKLRSAVMAATRKQRFEKVARDLKVTRLFSTLLEEMKAIGARPPRDTSRCTEVMVPAAASERSPVLLLMGGGMGAGKSTILKEVLKEPFWAEAAANAVMVEADAFKETDVLYRALSSRGEHHDMLQTAELVHQSSTDAAASLLVTALNEGRDVILDSTLSWEPFVRQTVAMARNVHRRRYRMGVGYKVGDDGAVVEDYWEPVEEEDDEEDGRNGSRKPYRIELVGVVCDAYLAVVRGIRRAIMMGRAVRVNSQLRSHKNFATAFPAYCELVDQAKLYSTNAIGGPPKLIGWKEGENPLLVDPEEIDCLRRVSSLNDGAGSVDELYEEEDPPVGLPGSIWVDVVLASSRPATQRELKMAILSGEGNPTPVPSPTSLG